MPEADTEQPETVLACPECDRASVQHASPDLYQCQACKATFDKSAVVERDRRGSNGIRGDSLAAQLDDLDADLVTDGGTDTCGVSRMFDWLAGRYWGRRAIAAYTAGVGLAAVALVTAAFLGLAATVLHLVWPHTVSAVGVPGPTMVVSVAIVVGAAVETASAVTYRWFDWPDGGQHGGASE